jgi:hypothetical protein
MVVMHPPEVVVTPKKKVLAATTPWRERGYLNLMRSINAMELLGFPTHSRSSHPTYYPIRSTLPF